ncbi:MAG: histidine phosphatase family protein [Microbacterium sp.]
MTAKRIHLVRHGEVDNPGGVLYERIPGFGLSDDGRRMAQAAADHLAGLGRDVTALVRSPLQRTAESAEPVERAFGLAAVPDERVIEPWNRFAGKVMRRTMANPLSWRFLLRPSRPSWGEPYAETAARMRDAMDELWERSEGDAVVVSHQAPIWITHLAVAGEPLAHNPTTRRCALSSVTSFTRDGGTWREVDYAEPASTDGAVDVGAV